jgi:oligosaccharyl transferase (archaeosortase A-associated)
MAGAPRGRTALSEPRRRSRGMLLPLLIAAGALIVRVAGPFDRVFRTGWVNFDGDAWYHMRAIDHLIRNFPHRLTFDPYAAPGAPYVAIAPLFDYLVATLALAFGLGSPSAALVERIAAVVPAVLAAATTLLVYVLGSRIFDRRAGLLGAALLAVMPGPFMERTLLGAADHHAAESVLVLLVMCLAVLTCQRETGAPAARPTLVSWMAGVTLGAYFLTWTSAPLFAFGLGLWAAVQFIANRLRSRSSGYLASLILPMSATALAMVFVFQNPALFRYWLQVEALSALLVLGAIIFAGDRVRLRGWIGMALTAAALGAAGLALGAWHLPVGLLQDLARFDPAPLGRTIAEMQPLLSAGGTFSLAHPWNVFRTAFYVGVPALAILGWTIRARPDSGSRSLLLVWGAVTLAATLGQNRFGYYLAPILAVLTGWTCSSFLAWIESRRGVRWRLDLAIVLVAAVVFYPSMRLGFAASHKFDGMPDEWKRALDWLRADTPDPFGDPGMYLRRYTGTPMPGPAYTVMAWWDYGYWIVRTGRRVPVANPTQDGAEEAARFFTATTEAEAAAVLARSQARYVIADSELPLTRTADPRTLRGRFDAVILWAGRRPEDFFETMTTRAADGRPTPVLVFYPDYYRAMAVRLSRFDPGRVEPDHSTWVITFADRVSKEGTPYREIVQSKQFPDYAGAAAYRDSLGPGPHRLVGLDPDKTCAPLPALGELRLMHQESGSPGSGVRVFEIHAS